MKKKEKIESHFIPSPFSVVTSYENAFIKKLDDSVNNAVTEVLKYIARVTALAIKNGEKIKKAEDVDIEKAHKIGDEKVYQGVTYYVGGFNAKGVPLWRKKKDSGLKKIELWKARTEFSKCKTPKDCVNVLLRKGVVTPGSNLDKCNLYTAQRVCSVLLNTAEHFNMNPISISLQKLKGATAQAGRGRFIELNEDYFKDFNSDRYYNDCVVKWHKNQEENYKRLVEKKKKLQASGTWDATKGKDLDNKIKLAKEAAEKYRGWTVEYKGSACEDVVIHELGHILNAQCTGGCQVLLEWEYSYAKNPTKYLKDKIELSKELNQEHYDLWADYCKGVNLISNYAATKRVEGFAEMFVAYVHGDTELPKNIHDFYDKYFKKAKPIGK